MSDIHEIVRRLRDEDAAGVPAAENGNALIRRVAGGSNARYHHARLVQEWLAQPGRRTSKKTARGFNSSKSTSNTMPMTVRPFGTFRSVTNNSLKAASIRCAAKFGRYWRHSGHAERV
jgi:hypothetical protein